MASAGCPGGCKHTSCFPVLKQVLQVSPYLLRWELSAETLAVIPAGHFVSLEHVPYAEYNSELKHVWLFLFCVSMIFAIFLNWERVMKTKAKLKPREDGTAALEALHMFVLIPLQPLSSRTYFLNVTNSNFYLTYKQVSSSSPSWRSLELGFTTQPSLFLAKSLTSSALLCCFRRSLFGSNGIPFLFLLCLTAPWFPKTTSCEEQCSCSSF